MDCWFGSGRVPEPIRLILGDRAVTRAKDVAIPITAVAEEAAQDWFKFNLSHVDPVKQVGHVGKINAVLAQEFANRVHWQVPASAK